MERNHFSKKWCLSKDKTTTENISKAIFHTKMNLLKPKSNHMISHKH
jgi:hypothetical protein